MCKLCQVTRTAESGRWPKRVIDNTMPNLKSFVTTAHAEINDMNAPGRNPDDVEYIRSNLKETCLAIYLAIAEMDQGREAWWKDGAAKREDLRMTGEQKKLSEIQVFNNKCLDMVREMKAKVGTFAKWTLGVQDWDTKVKEDITNEQMRGLKLGDD